MADDPGNFNAYWAWRNSPAGKAAKEAMTGNVVVGLGATLAAAGVGYALWHLLDKRSRESEVRLRNGASPSEGRGR